MWSAQVLVWDIEESWPIFQEQYSSTRAFRCSQVAESRKRALVRWSLLSGRGARTDERCEW